jgi:outer membrane lipoprotein-sorting protein
MKRIAFLILILPMILIANDSDELLKRVQDRFSEIRDFSAEIKQEGNNPLFTGRLMYKKENQFRLDLKNMTIVSDGYTVWNYNKKENRVVIDDVRDSESFPFSFNTLLNDYPSRSSLSSSKEGNLNVLTLIPKRGSGLNFNRARLWINSDYLIERISLETGQEGEVNIRISDYKINQNLSESLFNFIIPEGSRIIDLR